MDVTLVVSQLTESAAALEPAAGGGAGSAAGGTLRGLPSAEPAPDQDKVVRFRRAMGEVLPGDDLAGPQDLHPGVPGQAARASGPPSTAPQRHVGDAILSGLNALSGDLQRIWSALQASAPAASSPAPARWVGPAESIDLTDPAEHRVAAARVLGDERKTAAPEGSEGQEGQEGLESPESPDAAPQGNPMPRIADLLQMQRHMTEFAVLFEAAGKGTSKVIDNTNQLVKMQ